ncbi:hypothetical protein HDG40_004989 [Paraburkholderia sp. JPY158]|uniref:Uncharacterized protein n=1 Tax=Paraburkholderia atlantica TaxID=2654982 RepID=A0A7W8QBT9_PARAM|nr:hypothetical protein [Paraburkholderia atlantica]
MSDVVKRERVLRRARHAEVVRCATDGQNQRVVLDPARRYQFGSVVVEQWRKQDVSRATIQSDKFALNELEAVPLCLRGIRQFLCEWIETSRCDLVQQGLPDMRRVAVDQRNGRTLRPASSSTAITIA